MRPQLVVGGLLGLFVLALPVRAQLPPPAQPIQPGPPVPTATTPAAPEYATVVVPEVKVRSGASAQFYETSSLRSGEQVQVIREVNKDWLAIKPPRDSYSWINSKFVVKTERPGLAVVFPEDAEVPILAGSSIRDQQPNATVGNAKLGTIVTIVGPAHRADNNDFWIPVAPMPSEVRFLPATAVQRNTNSVQVVANSPLANAERQLLQKAYEKETDPALKEYFRKQLQAQSDVQQTVVRPQTGLGPAPGVQTSNPGITPNVNAANASKWSEYGILRRTAFQKDGQAMYALEDRAGRPLLYVATQPGMSLDSYLGRTVSLYGTTSYYSDGPVRSNVMTATHVAVP